MNENNRSTNKLPLYIDIYNRLLETIKSGVYNETMKLPSEVKLAQLMGVSRITLRQSLMLLQEDGIIESRKGVGNFIRSAKEELNEGLEHKGDLLRKCGLPSITKVTCEAQLGTGNLYSNDVFGRYIPVILGANLDFYHDDDCVAHCFSIVPTDLDLLKGTNLANNADVSHLITDKIYNHTRNVKIDIRYIEDHDHVIESFAEKTTQFLSISEKFLDSLGQIICLNKYHIPAHLASIKVSAF